MAKTPTASGGFAGIPTAGKALILILLLGVLSAIFYFAFFMGLSENLENAQNKYAKLEQELDVAKKRQREFLQVSQELARREAIDAQNKRVLPEKAEIAGFLEELNRQAELSGLTLKLVEPQPEQPKDSYLRIPVSLKLGGHYHQLAKFFYSVGRSERAINMENISMALENQRTVTSGDDAVDIVLDASVLATTFRRPASTPKPAPKPAGGAR